MFYVHPPHVRRAMVVVVTISAGVVITRTFPAEVATLAHGFREGLTTLLIEHVLHHWGEIATATGAALAHHLTHD